MAANKTHRQEHMEDGQQVKRKATVQKKTKEKKRAGEKNKNRTSWK